MIKTPRLDPRYDCHRVGNEGVILVSETGQVALEGEIFADILALADGRPWSQIRSALLSEHGALALATAIEWLRKGGYVCEAEPVVSDSGFWSTLNLPPAELAERRQVGLRVLAVGGADSGPLCAALEACGVRLVKSDDAELTVVLARDLVDPELAALNEDFWQAGNRWMAARLEGTVLWLGPVFDPERGPCWACFAHRAAENRAVLAFLSEGRGKNPFPPAPSTGVSIQAASGIAALTIATRLWRQNDTAETALITLDLATPETRKHEITRRALCPVCGDPGMKASLSPTQTRFSPIDGGYRTTLPEATEARLRPHVSPITGIITRLEPYDLGSPFLNVFRADHRLFRASHSLASLRNSLRNTTAGKGRTISQARVSAMCEAIERHSGVYDGTEPRISAPMALLDGAIHPAECLLFSQHQYATRDDWNARHSNFAWVPMPFDDSRTTDWSPCQSLVTGTQRFLPTALCYYEYPLERDHLFAAADSNGCASGNTREEAILQGFMELIERDSVALWWYSRARRPAVDLDSADDPWIAAVRSEFARLNRDLWAIDLTADIGIPAYAAISRRQDARQELVQGYGAHFDAQIALSRALTECTQMLAHLNIEGSTPGQDADLDDWFNSATTETEPYLLPDPLAPAVSLPQPRRSGGDLRDEVTRCAEAVRAMGLDMLVLDQTRPDIGFPVVKVFVPGLRHFWARFAPGRLYDVPVKLGWIERPLAEADLNPRPICS
ncbi:MAG TPA: TOMM precursor leader peptide-binding protein [Allosphingosinicella sp.]|jgi:ribosomal protein S12 methylthiotransferase accessory factor